LYKVGGGALATSASTQVGGPVSVNGATLNFGGRFVFLALDTPVGPYIKRDITVNGLTDAHGFTLTGSTTAVPIVPTVSPQGIPPGAYLTGRVLLADGTPVPNAPVIYWTQPCLDFQEILPPIPEPITVRKTDVNGQYEIDYVRNGDCGPVVISATNPANAAEKRVATPVVFDGQHMVLDTVFLARGSVQGTVTSGGQPAPFAFVKVVPALDANGVRVVQADGLGRYLASDIPVGNVSVLAVGTGTQSNASGQAAGNISGPGTTATINVSMQNVSGSVQGRVVNSDSASTPDVGALVIAFADLGDFGSDKTVGFAYTGTDGSFTINNLPIGNIRLQVTDYATGIIANQPVQLTQAVPTASNILIVLPGTGTVTGQVVDEVGTFIPNAVVQNGNQAVAADGIGFFTLTNLPAGNQTITATDPNTRLSSSVSVLIPAGNTVSGVRIAIVRPAIISGHVFIANSNGTTSPVAGAIVTYDGIHQVQTDANGLYTLNNVSANTSYTLRFVHPGQTLAVNQPIVVAAGETVSRDATFRPAAIHGKIFQPDGVTGTVAGVTLFSPLPTLDQGEAFGLLTTERSLSTQSGSDGSYAIGNFNAGTFRVSASNSFFPIRVSRGGVIAAGEDQANDLVLVTTLAGKIHGRVLQPDGVTPVGAGVKVTLGGGSLANVTVNTDANGHYEFAEVFAAGTYDLTATDPVTGASNRSRVSVQSNQDAVFDIRLLGTGGLRVHVVDGGGAIVQNGSAVIDGTGYPNVHGFVQLTTDSSGIALFSNLPEGQYAVVGSSNGLSGRASVFVPAGAPVDVTVQTQASGTVSGTIFQPDGTTPVSLADIRLLINGQSVGFTVSSNTDDHPGTFSFPNVPAGEFILEGFDNRSGRVARSGGRISTQGETAVVNLTLVPVGAVTGRVTQNGSPVDHATVEITAGESGFNFTSLKATTDPNGSYRFTGIPVGVFRVSVTNGPGGLAGGATGTINSGPEPLPDTVVDITLAPSATVAGTVFRFGGAITVNGAHITATVNGRIFETSTDANGNYRIDWLPLGQIQVQAEAPTGFDRGIAIPVTASQPGSTVTANVTLNGVGNVTGSALDSNGSALFSGNVTLTNDSLQPPINMTVPVDASGHYSITGAPAGPSRLTLVVAGRVEVGTANIILPAGQTIDVPLRLADAGTVTGKVLSVDGLTPATGADVTLSVTTLNNQTIQLYTHTNNQGLFTVANVPLGAVKVSIFDAITGGVAFLNGGNTAQLTTNGQTVDIGTLTLDNAPITIASVTPANNATGVSDASVVTVRFSEAASPATINNGTIQLLQGQTFVPSTVTLSADGKTATLTPTSRLSDLTTYTVVVTTGVSDLTNHFLVTEFRSTFTTDDETAPSVVSISPVANALDVPLDSTIVVTFSEPINRIQDLTTLITVTTNQNQQVTGSVVLDDTGKILTFTPTGGLVQSTIYTVKVTGQSDLVGNVQTTAFTSNFTSFNPAPTVSITSPAEGATPVEGTTITVAATASDDTSIASVGFTVNGFTIATVTASPYQTTFSIPIDTTSVLVVAKATDSLGKFTTTSRTVAVRKSNRAPVVNAGADQTVELPNVASLSGSATDDGLPEGSVLAYTWAKISGPGSVTFADPGAASTTASFGAPGTYVLQLAVSDSLLVGTDTITILATPANQAPIVSAGANQSISYPNLTANLNGSVTDDGLPHGSSVTSTWSEVAGLGTAVFLNPSAPVTTVTFSAPGIYRLRLTATDTALSASSDVIITVGSACLNIPTGLVAWWRGDGDAHDSALQGHDGTSFGGVSFGNGILGQSFNFDGTGSVQVSDDASLKPNQFTMEGWVKFDTLDTPGSFNVGREFVVFKQNGTPSAFGPDTRGAVQILKERVNTNDDRLEFIINQGANSLITARSTTKMSIGQFYHFAATYDGSTMNLYINGILESSSQAPGLSFGSGPLVFGSSGLGGDSKLTGSIDEVHFFNRVLTGSEIGSLILSDRTENCAIPIVNAGPDQTVTLPATASLSGTANIINDPNAALTYTWTTVSGPASVSFADPSSLSTTASFTTAGTYVLQLAVSNGQKTGTANTTIRVITPCISAPSGMIGWWKGEVDARDSLNLNNGTTVNGVTFAQGVDGQAFQFNGTNYIQIPDSPTLKPANITVDVWVRFDSLDTPGGFGSGLQYIVNKSNTRTDNFEGFSLTKFRDSSGDRLFFVVTSSTGVKVIAGSTSTVVTGQFYHLTGTYDGSNARIYVNGILEGTALAGFPMDYGTRPMFFGTSGETSLDGKLVGLLDEVHIFNRALAPSEIAAIDVAYQNGICSPPAVNAGQDQAITLPATTVNLNGSATDPLNDGALSYQWTATSGPAPVTFGDPSSPVTTATFTQAGIYTLRLSATAGQRTGSDDVTINVSAGCITPPSGLSSWWKAEGNANDSEGLNNGTLNGVTFAPGVVGQGFKFSGSSFVSVPDSPTLRPAAITIDTWVRFDSLDTPGASAAGVQYLYFKRGNGVFEAYSLLKLRNNGQDNFVFVIGSDPTLNTRASVVSTTAINVGQFYHVTATYDQANIKLYINGVLEASQPVTYALGYQSGTPLIFGSSEESFNGRLNGVLDEIHLFNRALTPTEVAAIRQANQNGICSPPIVDAGQNQTIALPDNTADLNGSASNPSNPGATLNYSWSVVSGPGQVTFGNAAAPATTATFSALGTYVLKLSASNGQSTGAATVTIRVLPACDAAENGLVSWWRGEGNASDSFNLNNGTLINNTSFAPAVVGQGFLFNGANSVNIPDSTSTRPAAITLDAWVRFDAMDTPGANDTGLQYLAFKRGNGPFEAYSLIKLRRNGADNFWFFIGSDPNVNTRVSVTSTTSINVGQFYHVTGTYDGATVKLYVNGVLEASQPASFAIGYQPGKSLFFGSTNETFDGKLTGVLDEVHLYNRALTATEITAIDQAKESGTCTTPIVNAGPNQTIGLPNFTANLNGSAVDPTNPTATLTYDWSVVSGPSTVVFGNPSSAVTTASFGSAGTYVLQLSVNNGTRTGTGTVTIQVLAACDTLPTGLVSWWRAEGNADDFLNQHSGSLINNPAFTPAIGGQGFLFDGTNYVQVPDSPDLKPANVTVDTWVRFDAMDTPNQSLPGLEYLVFKHNSRTDRFEGYNLLKLRVNGQDKLRFYISSVDGVQAFATSTTNVVAGQFYHVAGTYDGVTVKLYINGVLEGQATGGFPINYNTRPLFFGTTGESGFDGKLIGVLDDLHLFNRALTAAEIQSIFQAHGSAICTGGGNPVPAISARNYGWTRAAIGRNGFSSVTKGNPNSYAGTGTTPTLLYTLARPLPRTALFFMSEDPMRIIWPAIQTSQTKSDVSASRSSFEFNK
jgi:uncharacterized GH25 family protein